MSKAYDCYGVTKAELERQTKSLYEEVFAIDPVYTEEVTDAVLGVKAWVWSNCTVRQLTAIRRCLFAAALHGRGSEPPLGYMQGKRGL